MGFLNWEISLWPRGRGFDVRTSVLYSDLVQLHIFCGSEDGNTQYNNNDKND